ncbi:macrolide 2'-phosphotransferase [Zhihengliuella sp.]|uniref:macrolide 2'-phosphotransferase n=1 Tax=Zhihengliuella sp. TaxID=1954483 RepID=UPI0028128AC8|nr:macrolide 2'-phosphotransferase [Zhihengliuella sp.]
MGTETSLLELAARHGLELRPEGLRVDEAGLDYRVAFATDAAGTRWVLRVPRRADVSAKVADEKRILDFLAPVDGERRLSVEIPRWEVATPELVAYRLLRGAPGLTLEAESGEPVLHFDPSSPAYLESFGRLVAELHAISPEDAAAAGLVVETPGQIRDEWRRHLAEVRAEFRVAPTFVDAWTAWLDDDAFWPERPAFGHGELYPAHLLLDDDGRILSVLDWTTAKVGDPALDFALHAMMATEDQFDAVVGAYRAAGGADHPHLADRCAALAAAGPLNYAVFALVSGAEEHRATAQALLDPPAA